MLNKKAIFAAMAAVSMMSGTAMAQTNLVKNGDFSTSANINATTSSRQLNNSTSSVANWTNAATTGYTNFGYNFLIINNPITNGFFSLGGNHDYVYGPGGTQTRTDNGTTFYTNNSANGFTGSSPAPAGSTATTGGNYMLLDGDTAFQGALSQEITGLTVGGSYMLTFDWAGLAYFTTPGVTTQRFDVSFGGTTQRTATLTTPEKGFSGWQKGRMWFTATSVNQTLSFLAQGTPNGLPPSLLLDNVSVVAVPEPATWAMMIVGVGAMGGSLRSARRRRTAAVAA